MAHDRIVVYESVGESADEVVAKLREVGLVVPGRTARLREILERRERFTPVLRFVLVDAERRTFTAERRKRLEEGSRWIEDGAKDSVGELAKRLIPQLGRGALR